jgi:hypothetical protein
VDDGSRIPDLDDAKHADGKDPKTSAAGCYALYEGVGKIRRPVGECGRRVASSLIGTRVEHWLNGVRVVASRHRLRGMEVESQSEQVQGHASFGTTGTRGRIVLQDHGDDVLDRNIRIRTFDGTAARRLCPTARTLPDGMPTSNPPRTLPRRGRSSTACSRVQGRTVGVREDGSRLRALHPRALVAVFAGHEGRRKFRGALPHDGARQGVAALASKRNSCRATPRDFFRIGGFSLEAVPERTKGSAHAETVAAENPVGEWNRYEIEVDGGDVELRVNGKVVNRGSKADLGAGKICLQSEGVEIHFKDVEIVPIKR